MERSNGNVWNSSAPLLSSHPPLILPKRCLSHVLITSATARCITDFNCRCSCFNSFPDQKNLHIIKYWFDLHIIKYWHLNGRRERARNGEAAKGPHYHVGIPFSSTTFCQAVSTSSFKPRSCDDTTTHCHDDIIASYLQVQLKKLSWIAFKVAARDWRALLQVGPSIAPQTDQRSSMLHLHCQVS